MSTLFVWTGTVGPLWDSQTVNSDGTAVTNWEQVPGGKTDMVPVEDSDSVAEFNDGGIHSVGGEGSADEISVTSDTTLTFTNAGTGTHRFEAGDLTGPDASDFPDDLVVDNSSKLIVGSGAGLQNGGTTDVVGLGNTLFGGSGDGTLEVDSGGIYEAEGLIVGDSTDGNGVVTIDNAQIFTVISPTGGSPASGNGWLVIGQAGTGSVSVTDTPFVFTQSAVLGLNQGAVGSLSIDSPDWGGGNVTIGAAGTGHMTVGAGATVALLSVIVGEDETGSGDLLVTGANQFNVDFLTIGSSGTGTATFAADSVGIFASVTVGESTGAIANMTLDGSAWNASGMTIGSDGTGQVTVGAGEVVTVTGDDVLGAGADASGDMTVDSAVLNGGTLTIGQDGTGDLEIGSDSSGSVDVVVVGADEDSQGTLTIEDGATWNAGSLTVGQTGNGEVTVGTGATSGLDNILIGPNGSLAVTETSGSVGTVIARQVTLDFGTLDLSGFGQMLIGAATGASNGAVAIGAHSSLVGAGLLDGDVVLSGGGIVTATAPVPGALQIDGDISGDGTIQPLMTLEVNGVIGPGVTIGFGPSIGAQVGDLVLDVPGGEDGTIAGFGAGNTIDIQGSLYSTALFTAGVSGAAGTLTLSGGPDTPLTFAVAGDYGFNSFTATPGTTDTVVTVMQCFGTGTRIATPAGEVAVERLRVGDAVVTHDGESRAITRIGRRRVDCRRHPEPHKVWPVRVDVGAFGPDQPRRPLRLSPDHAVFVEDVLIPVKHLIDGASVTQVPTDEVTYYHIELARHDVLLAEGLPVESWLNSGDCRDLGDGDGVIALYPDFSTRGADMALLWEAHGYAPLVVTGPIVAGVRRRLRERAADVSSFRASEAV